MPSRRQRSVRFTGFRSRGASTQVAPPPAGEYVVESGRAGLGISHSVAEPATPSVARPWTVTRLQVIAVTVSLAVVIAGWFPVAPVRDSATLQDIAEVTLVRPQAYVDFAPFSDVLDAITLLSERQHIALLLGLAAIWGLWRFARPGGMRQGWRKNMGSFAILVTSIGVAYAAAAYLPRPMAHLTSLDPDVLRIDFHSHTQSSKDARRSYSIERNRAWHHAGGYDVAFVTDHDTFAGAEHGLADDPSTWNGSTILLGGIEVSWKGEHVGLVGDEPMIRCMLSANLHDFDPQNPLPARCHSEHGPIVVWNHPRDPQLAKLPLASGAVRGIEIANGALHSLDLVRSKRERIVSLARQHNLSLLSGTDTHGWGYAAPDWTLLRLEGWRHFTRDELAARIEQALRVGGFGATRVVERTTADYGTNATELALSVVLVPWRMLTALSADERKMWLLWALAIVAVEWGLRRRRISRPGLAATPAS